MTLFALNLSPAIQIGTVEECRAGDESLAVVHVVSYPCRSLISDSRPIIASEFDLFLTLPSQPFASPSLLQFQTCLDWCVEHWSDGRAVLMHCTLAESRSPSLALALMARRLNLITATSPTAAIAAFTALHPIYDPSPGILSLFDAHWDEL